MLNYTIYKISDDAEWVTFIHGAGGSSKVWYRQIKAFKEKYNVLLIDQKDSAGEDIPFFNKLVKTQIGFLKIARKFNLPIIAVGMGEKETDLHQFNSADFAKMLIKN